MLLARYVLIPGFNLCYYLLPSPAVTPLLPHQSAVPEQMDSIHTRAHMHYEQMQPERNFAEHISWVPRSFLGLLCSGLSDAPRGIIRIRDPHPIWLSPNAPPIHLLDHSNPVPFRMPAHSLLSKTLVHTLEDATTRTPWGKGRGQYFG